MKIFFGILLSLISFIPVKGQSSVDSIYNIAMNYYEKKLFKEAAFEFDKINSIRLRTNYLYDGACIYSLNNEQDKSISILKLLSTERYYSNLSHITKDTDLNELHGRKEWSEIIATIESNKTNLPFIMIPKELKKVEELLKNDAGKLWGENLWHDDIIILGEKNTAYTLKPINENSLTKDSLLYYFQFPENTFGYSNSVQEYDGKKYATLLFDYIKQGVSTTVHELFHTIQFRHRAFHGTAIVYLDNYDAREWMSLEFQALQNCLSGISRQQEASIVKQYLADAMIFRKIRQSKYPSYTTAETEIETLEGLADYTAYTLASPDRKYDIAISKLRSISKGSTYTRNFAYPAGLAYGLIFDHLSIKWRNGIDTIYNFLYIYEKNVLRKSLRTKGKVLLSALKRNDYAQIKAIEAERKAQREKKLAYFRRKFLESPSLKVTLLDGDYMRTSDADRTFVLDSVGVVYTDIFVGSDYKDLNFGNFKLLTDIKKENEIACVLESFNGRTYTFPTPFTVEKSIIKGDFYQIELKQGWTVKKINPKGDYEILKQ